MMYAARLLNKTFPERRRILYHKPEVERIWEEWLALPADDDIREQYRQQQRDRVRQISQVSLSIWKKY